MHWVERGPEPEELNEIRERYTQRWIDYYRHGKVDKPSDSRWRDFHDDLRRVFSGLCAYCEETCKGEVEHFRPKSKFPELVYEWSNWLFACHDCNHMKLGKWPGRGYVDPCAKSKSARPENYFTFDLLTGEIIPKEGLSETRYHKAARMIRDLDLNAFHHLKKRLERLVLIAKLLEQLPNVTETVASEFREHLRRMTFRQIELSSISRTMLSEIFPLLVSG